MTRRGGHIIAFAVLGACTITEAEGGALGNGTFDYGCVDSSDAYCPTLGASAPFPSVIALGSKFSMTYEPNGSNDQVVAAVLPVSPDFVTTTNGPSVVFDAVRPGRPWFAAWVANGQVEDIASINVAALTSMSVTDTTSGTLLANVGDTHGFSAIAMVGSTEAAGAIPYSWSVTPGGTILPSISGAANTINVLFHSKGQITVTASALGATGSAIISVGQ